MTESTQTTVEETKTTILVVTSKVKEYAKTSKSMSVSAEALENLTDLVKKALDAAADKAAADGRKIVKARDFQV